MKEKIDLTGKCGSCYYFHQIEGTARGECHKLPYSDDVAHDLKHPYVQQTRSRPHCKMYRTKNENSFGACEFLLPDDKGNARRRCEAERELDETGGSGMKLTYWNDRKGHFDWHCENNEIADKLAAYEDAEEQGLLIRLPCKVGDTVFVVEGHSVYKSQVDSIALRDDGLWLDGTFNRFGLVYFSGEIGLNVFLTRAEAEAMLKGAER